MRRCRRADRQRGATAVEYALIVAFVVGVIVVVVALLGQRVSSLYSSVPPF